jgi:EmrB/QacA subfamily drug resistance transporter
MNPTIIVPLIVACALFMEMVDSTVIATSLPIIARDFGRDPLVLKLGLTSYLLSLAVFIPVSGWVCDRFGGRRVFRAAIGVFMVSSMLCGVAQSFGFFVAARFLQGMGGAMMVPVGRIVILRTVPREEFVTAIAYLTTPAMLGPVVGPPLGGLITTYLSWRWIFYLNIPMSILGIFLAGRYMENFREPDVPRLDMRGFLLSASGLLLAMFGLTTITDRLMPMAVSIACIALGMLALAGYVYHARYAERPLLDLRLFRFQTYAAGLTGGTLFRVGVGSIGFMLPMLLQIGFGLSPVQSGFLTCSVAIGSVIAKPLAKPVLALLGFRRMLAWNAVISGAWIASFGLFRPSTHHALIFLVLLIAGCFYSLQFTALNAIPYAELPDSEVSQATSLYAMVQQLSLGSGVALGALALQGSSFLQGHQKIVTADFWPAFLLLGAIAISAVVSAARLPAEAGALLAGRQHAKPYEQRAARQAAESD